MKKNNFRIIKLDKTKNLFNYEKKILIKELTLDLKLGYYDFEKEKSALFIMKSIRDVHNRCWHRVN